VISLIAPTVTVCRPYLRVVPTTNLNAKQIPVYYEAVEFNIHVRTHGEVFTIYLVHTTSHAHPLQPKITRYFTRKPDLCV